MIDRTHVACLAAGAALASAFFYLTQRNINKKTNIPKDVDFNSAGYLQIKEEQLARIIKYFGQEKFRRLQESYVIVFGVGGVGSHVVNMLARSGVGRIRIVDFDRVSLSSLNRHSCAVRKDVGTSKVHCLKAYIGEILPHVVIETVQQYVTVQNAADLLPEKADYVVDCIDNLDAKAELVSLCHERGIPLICSGGAGMKSDPTRLQIRDISDCKYDNLIMRLKRELTKKGIKSGVKVCFSYQQAQKQLLPLKQHQEGDPKAYKVFDNYRIRIIPVLGTMPAIIGMSIASYVLTQLADEPYKPFQTDYVKSTAFNKIYQQLLNDERKRGVSIQDMQVDLQQVAILAKVAYKWRSVVSGKKETNPRLVRWNPDLPATIDNLALMNKHQYQKHWQYKSIKDANYSEEVIDRFKEGSSYAKQLYDKGFMMFI